MEPITQPPFVGATQRMIEQRNMDYYIVSGSITSMTADNLVELIRRNPKPSKECGLFLTTNGGDPDAGYRMARMLLRHYQEGYTLYVMGMCKSTGTLLALGAKEIVMGDYGELGPLDIQLAKDDEFYHTSGLNLLQSLVSLNDQMYTSWEKCFLDIKGRSQNVITTKTAAEVGSKLAIGMISPISAQIDPVKLGEVQRSMTIARAYGLRLKASPALLNKLITEYPCHSFVIDREEAKDLFGNVRVPTDSEQGLYDSVDSLRFESTSPIVDHLNPYIAPPPANGTETALPTPPESTSEKPPKARASSNGIKY